MVNLVDDAGYHDKRLHRSYPVNRLLIRAGEMQAMQVNFISAWHS